MWIPAEGLNNGFGTISTSGRSLSLSEGQVVGGDAGGRETWWEAAAVIQVKEDGGLDKGRRARQREVNTFESYLGINTFEKHLGRRA